MGTQGNAEAGKTNDGKAAKPRKISTLAFLLTKFESKPTAGGHQRYILTGTEVNGRDSKEKRLTAFEEVGVKLEGAMVEQGIDPARIDPALAVTFKGSWEQKTITPKGGQPFKAWEFKVDDFAFGVQERSKEQAASKSEQSGAKTVKAEDAPANAPAEGSAGDKPKKEPKILQLIADKYETKTIANGSFCLNIYGRDDQGRKAHAVAWRAQGEALSGALERFGLVGEENKVAITLTGFWKPSKWTNDRGQEKTNFEFVIQEFSRPMTPEEHAAQRNQADRVADTATSLTEKPAPAEPAKPVAKAKQPELAM